MKNIFFTSFLFLCLAMDLHGKELNNHDSTLYNKWEKEVKDAASDAVCNVIDDKECITAIHETCSDQSKNSVDYQNCKTRTIYQNSNTYGNYIAAIATETTISAMIDNNDISGLKSIIKGIKKYMGTDLKNIESIQYNDYVFAAIKNNNPEILEILLKTGNLDPFYQADSSGYKIKRINNKKSPLDYTKQKMEEALQRKDLKEYNSYCKIMKILTNKINLSCKYLFSVYLSNAENKTHEAT